MNNELSFQRFLDLLGRRWKLFALIAAMAAALGALLSSPVIMKPRYRSEAIVYPVNLNSYSIETRTDQLLQLLESNAIRDSVLLKFDLMHHWKKDSLRPGGKTYLYLEYLDRIDISKTRYESVELEVVDESPDTARAIVDEILRQVNLLARRLQREKSAEVLDLATRIAHHAKVKMDSAETRLKEIREKYGLLVYEAQTEELTKGYVRMLTSGSGTAQKEEVKGMLHSLQEAGGEFRGLTDLADMFRQNYNAALLEQEHAQNDMTKELTYVNVVISPETSDKKVWPVRWLVVLISMVGATFLAFVFMAWKDNRVQR